MSKEPIPQEKSNNPQEEQETDISVEETVAPEPEKIFPIDYLDIDKEDARKAITSMPEHIRAGYKLTDLKPSKPFKRVVVAGMGGSGIAGDLLGFMFRQETNIPLITVKDYEPPKNIGEDDLFIAVSYSGNTEETLSSYKLAARAGAQCVLMSSGGKAQDLAKLNKHPHILLPQGLQPRMAVAYLFFPLLKLMENAGVLKPHEAEIKELIEGLRRQPEKAAVDLSEKLFETTPIMYADTSFFPVAYRWKTQINENAKAPAFAHVFSEQNHNEILGFSNRFGPFHVIILTSDKYHRRVQKRIALTKSILQKKGVPVTEIAVKGTPLKQLFTAIYLGDLASYYLALRYEIDPTPVAIIEQLKKDLGPFLI